MTPNMSALKYIVNIFDKRTGEIVKTLGDDSPIYQGKSVNKIPKRT